jgi:ERF superfamily
VAEILPSSPGTASIEIALAAVKNAVGAVAKAERNTQQNFNFRGVDAVVNAAAPALNKFGVIVLPRVISHTYEQVTTSTGKLASRVILEVEYAFTGPAGDVLVAVVMSESMDYGDKAMAKAMSVAYRTVLLQVLNLPTDEKDPDESIYEQADKPAPAAVAPAAKRAGAAKSAPAAKGSAITDAQMIVDLAEAASNAETVRGLYEIAASRGWLNEERVHPSTGEKLVIKEFLIAKGNELKHDKSGAAATAGTGGGSAA